MKMIKEIFGVAVVGMLMASAAQAELYYNGNIYTQNKIDQFALSNNNAFTAKFFNATAAGGGSAANFPWLAENGAKATFSLTNPGDVFTLSTDVTFSKKTGGDSLGIYLINGSTGNLALLNSNPAADDQFRYFTGISDYTGGGTGTNIVNNSRELFGSGVLSTSITLQYGIGLDGVKFLTYTAGKDALAYTYTLTAPTWDSFQIGFRVYIGGTQTEAGNETLSLTNLTFGVTSIPEPSTLALLGIGAGLLLVLRRKKI